MRRVGRARDVGRVRARVDAGLTVDAGAAHVALRDAATGDVARDTRADMEPVQFVLSAREGARDAVGVRRRAGCEIEAMDACARTMVVGERATFDVPAELAYGEEGNFCFPAVGRNRALVLDLELLGCRGSAASPDVLQTDMTYETRIERVRGHRADGNAAFAAGDARAAIRAYSMALTYLTEDFMMQLFDKYEVEAREEFVAVHGNLAAAYLQLNEHDDVITHVGYVLRVDESNAKAYFRRGKARAALGQDDAAREDFLKAKRITEDAGIRDAKVIAALRDIEQSIRERERVAAAAFKGMFGHATPETASPEPGPPEPQPSAKEPWRGGLAGAAVRAVTSLFQPRQARTP